MPKPTGCDCSICAGDYLIAMVHDYVWEEDDEQDVR